MNLSADQTAIQTAARKFVQTEIAPYVAGWEQAGTYVPESVLSRMGDQGYFGLFVPKQMGGSEIDMVSYAVITEEFAAGDCGICNLMNASNSPVSTAIRDYGNVTQHQLYLKPMATGQLRACFLLTEAEAGSDASAISSRAKRIADGYLLNGSKKFCTGGKSAHLALVLAVTDPSKGKHGITAFLVPTDAEGYNVLRLEDKLGHRNCDTADIELQDVQLSRDQVLGKEGEGYRIALAYLNGGRIGVGAQSVGVARAAFEAALAYAKTRETFGQLIIDHQTIGFKLAKMATQITAARQLVLHAAVCIDAGHEIIAEASMAKSFASSMAEEVCSAAIQIHGGYGYLVDYKVEKYYRDARVLSIYEGSNDIQSLVITRCLRDGWRP
jgi:alkylation response protein AidB-like acyl-CoA dehydrogenase